MSQTQTLSIQQIAALLLVVNPFNKTKALQ